MILDYLVFTGEIHIFNVKIYLTGHMMNPMKKFWCVIVTLLLLAQGAWAQTWTEVNTEQALKNPLL